MANPYLSGKYWWLGVSAIVLFTLLLFHALTTPKPIPKSSPKPVVHTAPKPSKTQPSVPTQPVLDLFSPTAENLSHDQAVSRTRGELEQLLVISILLQRCGHIDDTQYKVIYRAGEAYAGRTELFSDSDALLRELLASAEKTYRLVYAQTDCTETSLQTLKAQTLDWQAQYSTQ